MARKDSNNDDYLNLESSKAVDSFALGDPVDDTDEEDQQSAPRILFIAPLIIGFVMLASLAIGVFIFRTWEREPIGRPEVRVVEEESQPTERKSQATKKVDGKVTENRDAKESKTTPSIATTNSTTTNPTVGALVRNLLPSIGMVLVRTPRGITSGSGFIIGQEGLFVTNFHVIEDALEIAIKLGDSDKIHKAYVKSYDRSKDLALLQFSESGSYNVLELEKDVLPELGEEVLVLGYPLGTKLGLDVTLSTGIVSSIRNYPEASMLQTNAAINHGNSGGPMILKKTGRVVGVVTARAKDSESIGFAVNVKELKGLLGD